MQHVLPDCSCWAVLGHASQEGAAGPKLSEQPTRRLCWVSRPPSQRVHHALKIIAWMRTSVQNHSGYVSNQCALTHSKTHKCSFLCESMKKHFYFQAYHQIIGRVPLKPGLEIEGGGSGRIQPFWLTQPAEMRQ